MPKAACSGTRRTLLRFLFLVPLTLACDSIALPYHDSCTLLATCREDAAARTVPWQNDAYIWQRSWTPAVAAAVEQSSDVIDGWRVLGAQTADDGHVQAFSPDWAALNASGKPLVLVIRIERKLTDWNEASLLTQIDSLVMWWRARSHHLAGVEIDHDCATGRLQDYHRFLGKLRERLGPGLRLSITALPDWLESPDLADLLNVADSTVLQVHAVQAPGAGIFDRAKATSWIDRFSRLTPHPFRIALPAYGARLAMRSDRSIVAVESEAPLLKGGVSFVELSVSPQEITHLLRQLAEVPPKHLSGIVWFRLPISDDKRAWSLATLRAVIEQAPLEPQITVEIGSSGIAGAVAILLKNQGTIDASLPRRVALPADCVIADGINGFSIDHEGGRLALVASQDRVLHEGHRLSIGWARCELTAENIDVGG